MGMITAHGALRGGVGSSLILLVGCATSTGNVPPDASTMATSAVASSGSPVPPAASTAGGSTVPGSAEPFTGTLHVQVHGGGRHTGREPFAVSARPSAEAIEVRLDGFPYYCGMGPPFTASLAQADVVIDTEPVPPGAALPQCFEVAPYVLHIGPLSPGRYGVRVQGRSHPEVSVTVTP